MLWRKAQLRSADPRCLYSTTMTLHFAYGSNMSRALMSARCPGAEAIGTATLSGWRFVINPEGFGSIAMRELYVAAGPVSRSLSARKLRQDGHSSGPCIAARL